MLERFLSRKSWLILFILSYSITLNQCYFIFYRLSLVCLYFLDQNLHHFPYLHDCYCNIKYSYQVVISTTDLIYVIYLSSYILYNIIPSKQSIVIKFRRCQLDFVVLNVLMNDWYVSHVSIIFYYLIFILYPCYMFLLHFYIILEHFSRLTY